MTRIFCLLSFLLLFPIFLFSQRISTSPYSAFGYGDLKYDNNASTSAMGGVSSSYISPFGTEFNFYNPATNASLKLTSFDLGVSSDISKYDSDIASEDNNVTYFSNISIGFPISEKLAAGFGFQPFSGVGYDLTSSSLSSDSITTIIRYDGNGGLNTAQAAISYKPFKDQYLSLGLTGQYIFGAIEHQQRLETDAYLSINDYTQSDYIKGISWTLGGLYKYALNDKNTKYLNLGATYTPKQTLKNSSDQYALTYMEYANGTPIPNTIDTVFSQVQSQDYLLPSRTSLSFSFEKSSNWMLGFQYDFEQISDFNADDLRTIVTYDDSHRLALGGYWIPNKNSYKSYFARTTYRAGLFYESTGVLLLSYNGDFQEVNNLGITFGMGLPVGKDQISSLNLSAELGQRGSLDNGLIKETYANLTLGVIFNSKWFNRRKYN